MRVAIFTDTYEPEINGVANTLSHAHIYLQKQGIPHLIFAPEYKGERGTRDYLVRIKGVTPLFSPKSKVAIPFHAAVKKQILKFKPTIIHVVTELTVGSEGLRIAKELGIPVIMSYHTNFEQYLKYFGLSVLKNMVRNHIKQFHQQAVLNLVPSKQTYSQLEQQEYQNLRVWSRGVDTTIYHPKKKSEAFRAQIIHEPAFLFLYVGRVSNEKGLEVLIPCIYKMNMIYKNTAVFIIAGDGPFLARMKAMNLPNTVYTGFVRGEELATLYASSDAFVFPSGTETFGNVLLEAMASGLPVICSDRGGVTDFTKHGENAYVTKYQSEDCLLDGMIRVKEDEILRSRMIKGAIETARSRSWDSVMRVLEQSYLEVAEEDPYLIAK